MNGNFWWIFISLLIGAVIGYEYGKYTVSRKLGAVLGKIGDDLKKAAEDIQRRHDEEETRKKEQEQNTKRLMSEISDRLTDEDLCRIFGIEKEQAKKYREYTKGEEIHE